MFKELIQRILKAAEVQVIVIGDFAIDLYLHAGDGAAESPVSLETGQPVELIGMSRFELGGAGNVAANLATLTTGKVFAIGSVGQDHFGGVLIDLLRKQGIGASGIVRAEELQTAVYAKVIVDGNERRRFDIGSVQVPTDATISAIIAQLEERIGHADAVIVNQQIANGCLASEDLQRGLVRILQPVARRGRVIVDSRDFADRFEDCTRKLNQSEAYHLARPSLPEDSADSWEWNPAHTVDLAAILARHWVTPVIVTRGEHGAAVAVPGHEGGPFATAGVAGLKIDGPVDTVGAGDSFAAGCALALAAGSNHEEAARFGTLVAGVTVQKLHRTGTATPAEVRELAAVAELNYNPEFLYADPVGRDPSDRGCCGHSFTILSRVPARPYRHVVFDHDGTISTLREGWEAVMRRHMLRAITGESGSCPPEEQARVMEDIDQFIDRTTGVQTIIQMHGLAEMVARSRYMQKVRTPAEYKASYVAELRERVTDNLQGLASGCRTVEDFTVRGAVDFLNELHERGVALYLASGTDLEDTRAEARALGYADLFSGIFGSVDDVDNDPKRVVLNQIFRTIPEDERDLVAVFGDGPVEMREGRRCGAACIGVMSDEVRRYGWNPEKRQRLVSAGAHLLIPDFTDRDGLVSLLWSE
jgi:bifunctional ADP-heptose synthase (sugar kinase/adenylyltransferase)/phosphoglycolate phosphatase-like HAD superfamily hydrolase